MATHSTVRCCVIGGAGFIGRPLVALLKETGREVIVLDQGPALEKVPATYHQGDYSNPVLLKKVLTGVDEIIHLAYASVPKTSFEDPAADLLHNIPPALTLFQTASERNIKKLVFVSSGGTVYGQAQKLPITEQHPTNPISPYGITKLAIEKYAGLFFASKQLPVVVVRPANAYGEEQKPFTGQGFIATAIASILQGKPITIFGDTGMTRDYVYVQDVARGILAALEKGEPGESYNLGTGVGATNKEITDQLQRLAKEAGLSIQVNHLPERSFDVTSNILDSTKITAAAGWKPTVSLEEGLRKSWDYMRAITVPHDYRVAPRI